MSSESYVEASPALFIELRNRLKSGVCTICKNPDHIMYNCSKRRDRNLVDSLSVVFTQVQREIMMQRATATLSNSDRLTFIERERSKQCVMCGSGGHTFQNGFLAVCLRTELDTLIKGSLHLRLAAFSSKQDQDAYLSKFEAMCTRYVSGACVLCGEPHHQGTCILTDRIIFSRRDFLTEIYFLRAYVFAKAVDIERMSQPPILAIHETTPPLAPPLSIETASTETQREWRLSDILGNDSFDHLNAMFRVDTQSNGNALALSTGPRLIKIDQRFTWQVVDDAAGLITMPDSQVLVARGLISELKLPCGAEIVLKVNVDPSSVGSVGRAISFTAGLTAPFVAGPSTTFTSTSPKDVLLQILAEIDKFSGIPAINTRTKRAFFDRTADGSSSKRVIMTMDAEVDLPPVTLVGETHDQLEILPNVFGPRKGDRVLGVCIAGKEGEEWSFSEEDFLEMGASSSSIRLLAVCHRPSGRYSCLEQLIKENELASLELFSLTPFFLVLELSSTGIIKGDLQVTRRSLETILVDHGAILSQLHEAMLKDLEKQE